jgi:hypothetical protein
MVLPRVCLDRKSFKLVKWEDDDAWKNTIRFMCKQEQEEDTLFDDFKPLSWD